MEFLMEYVWFEDLSTSISEKSSIQENMKTVKFHQITTKMIMGIWFGLKVQKWKLKIIK